MSHRKFWDQFWENRCVTLVDTEPEEDTAAAATEPPVGAVQMTEEDYKEYSAMLVGGGLFRTFSGPGGFRCSLI